MRAYRCGSLGWLCRDFTWRRFGPRKSAELRDIAELWYMPAKQVIALATHHHVQLKGHPLNNRFGQVISLIRENYPVGIILEEWTPERQSFASTVDTDKLKWRNV